MLKSASEKVKEKQMQDELEVINKTLKESSDAEAAAALDTQSIISNLMVSLKQGTNAAPDPVQDSAARGCNAENIAKVLSLIGSMAGQDVAAPTPAKASLLSLHTQPPPPPPPISEASQMSNQNMPANETFNQNMPANETFNQNMPANEIFNQNTPADERFNQNMPTNERYNQNMPANETFNQNMAASNFNMRGQSAMNQDQYERNNYPNSSQYPQSMHNRNPDTDFQNMLPRGNDRNDLSDDFDDQPQFNEMGYPQNRGFGNGNFRAFPAGINRGNQYPDDMRPAYGRNAGGGGNYQEMYDGDHDWENAQHRMLPQNQYGDRLPMEEDYYTSGYHDLPTNNFRGHNRNMNRGKAGKMRGRGNMDWRGGFMRN